MNFKIAQAFSREQLPHHTKAYTLTRPCYDWTDYKDNRVNDLHVYNWQTDFTTSNSSLPSLPTLNKKIKGYDFQS